MHDNYLIRKEDGKMYEIKKILTFDPDKLKAIRAEYEANGWKLIKEDEYYWGRESQWTLYFERLAPEIK